MKKLFSIISDIVETWLPALFLVTMFASFIISIFTRYILRAPKTWAFEAQSICFLLVAMLGICTAHKNDEHIVFDLFYVKADRKKKQVMRIVSDILVFSASVILTPAAVRFVSSLSGLKTQILKIPRPLVFSSFVIMCVLSALHSLIDLIHEVKQRPCIDDSGNTRKSEEIK